MCTCVYFFVYIPSSRSSECRAALSVLYSSFPLASYFDMSVLLSQSGGFPGGSEGKMSARNAGDLGLIPGMGRSPGEGNGNPLQCSCLENPRVGGAWWAAVYGVAQSRTLLKRLSSSSGIGRPGFGSSSMTRTLLQVSVALSVSGRDNTLPPRR